MNAILKAVTDFIFVEDTPEPSDLILIVGGVDPELGETAARLWRQGLAPLCLAGGGVSIKSGAFPGPASKREQYPGPYETEAAFLKDVLAKNGVPAAAVLEENRSSYTRENAELARLTCDEAGLAVRTALLVCNPFHARRALFFYQSAFPQARLLVCPTGLQDVTRENWYQTERGVSRVLGELRRCGDQVKYSDIEKLLQGDL